jgi:hypothetical protein
MSVAVTTGADGEGKPAVQWVKLVLPRDGSYQVTLSAEGWIDVIQNGKAAAAHTGKRGASARACASDSNPAQSRSKSAAPQRHPLSSPCCPQIKNGGSAAAKPVQARVLSHVSTKLRPEVAYPHR